MFLWRNRDFDSRSNVYQCHGAIINKNKIEDFKSCDKLELINEEGKLIWSDIASGACLHQPTLLSRFFIFSFGVNYPLNQQFPSIFWFSPHFQDLKAFNYYYNFAYPCPATPIFEKSDESKVLSAVFNADELNNLTQLYFPLTCAERAFFIVERNPAAFSYFKLSAKIEAANKCGNFLDANLDEIYFCFSDPCPAAENAGWPLRLFLLMLTHLWFVFRLDLFTFSRLILSFYFQSKLETEDDKNTFASCEKVRFARKQRFVYSKITGRRRRHWQCEMDWVGAKWTRQIHSTMRITGIKHGSTKVNIVQFYIEWMQFISIDFLQQIGRKWCLLESQTNEMASATQSRFEEKCRCEMSTFRCWYSWMLRRPEFNGEKYEKYPL